MLAHSTTLPCLQALQSQLAILCRCTDPAMCLLHLTAVNDNPIVADIDAELCTHVQDAQLKWPSSFQVTALGLINSAGKVGDVPTGVQFALKGMSAPTVRPRQQSWPLHMLKLPLHLCPSQAPALRWCFCIQADRGLPGHVPALLGSCMGPSGAGLWHDDNVSAMGQHTGACLMGAMAQRR